jgi:phosphoesterase RecJ-like protein
MNDPYQPILDVLSNSKRVLVTTHAKPDGDAIGSTAAAVLGLRKKGVHAEVLLLSRLPRKYAFLYEGNGVRHHDAEAGWPTSLDLADFDCLLVVDTGTWSQLPGLQEKIAGWAAPKLVVDHHLTQENWATQKLVDTTAAAAAEVVAELFERWAVPLDAPIATALYVALTSDTGWFQFSSTRPYTMRLGARLMEAGVDTDKTYQLIYQNERAERLALQTRAMQSMELLAGGRVAVQALRLHDFEKSGADGSDTENLINIPLQIATVQVSIMVVESPSPGSVRVSLRSKGSLDVARLAERFGGGGHARAAGLRLDGDISAARERVVRAVIEALAGAG